ncbi:terminase family protein, partial [Nostoc sp. NIES-2111]
CERLGFVPDAMQRRALGSEEKRVILNCTRQWGKSSVTAIRAIYTALQGPEATVLVMSPSERQSGEFLRKVREYLARLGGTKLRGDGVNKLSVVLPNGSRVVALPGVEATMRGFSAVDLLIVDEAARVKDRQYEAAGPMLAVKDGALWLLSTPFGARGFFWKEWELGGEDWLRLEVKATDCARISAQFLEREKTRISAEWYRQEYLCEFLGAEHGPFRKELLDAAMEDGLEDLF